MKTIKLYNIILLLLLVNTRCQDSNKSLKVNLFGQENAVWTESKFLRGYKPSNGKKLTNREIKNFAHNLKNNNVKYAYLFAGPYQEDGHLPEYPYSEIAKHSVEKLKEYYPEIVILPWIGGIQNKTVYLGDSTWVKNALMDTKRLIESLKVPGVHIDFEYILKGNPYLDTTIELEKPLDKEAYANNVNSFHARLRVLLPDSFISSVVTATSPDTKPWKRKTTIKELSILIKHIDQLSFLYYDTHINSQDVFEQNCVSLIRDMETLKQFNERIQLLIGIGTFINRPELRTFRDLKIENISNSLTVIKKSVTKVNDAEKIVDGIAIFCDWETDKLEWKDFYTNWVKD